MARLPYLDKKDLAPEHQDLLNQPINLNRILVTSPHCRRASLAFAQYFRSGSRLDPRLRELAILMVGYLTRSAYEWCQHIRIGRAAGVSDADIAAVIAMAEGGSPALDEAALATLRMAQEITIEGAAGDASFATLGTYLDPEQLLDLVVVTAHYTGVARVIASMQVEVEAEYLPYLEEFPLPR
ncbi:MAG TPA: carboxymuconolactone decarboxylase family protein [Devosia sp.]|nr:carboxymuconolactone decarboxylase family protein [Devosia sp.]